MPLIFDPLPETELTSDAANFVCEFPGGNDASETGAGGGLAGANLVLTRFGAVGAASSGWRAVSANGGFNITSAWVDAFVRNASGFAMLWHLKNVTTAGSLFYLDSSSPSALEIYCTTTTNAYVTCKGTARFGVQGSLGLPTVTDLFPSSGELFILMSVDYTNGLSFVGVSIGNTQPSVLSDFDWYCALPADQITIASTITLTAGYLGIIGRASSGAAFSVKSITARKGPSVSLA